MRNSPRSVYTLRLVMMAVSVDADAAIAVLIASKYTRWLQQKSRGRASKSRGHFSLPGFLSRKVAPLVTADVQCRMRTAGDNGCPCVE